MKYCPDCHKKMVETTVYEKYCSDIGETIAVVNCEPYLTCPDGCVAHVPGEVLDALRLQIQGRIEEWIFNRIQSFDDFSKLFYTKAQALAYIKRQAKVISCNDAGLIHKSLIVLLTNFVFMLVFVGKNSI